MAFWDGVTKGVKGFFSGDKKKKDEQTKKPRPVGITVLAPKYNPAMQPKEDTSFGASFKRVGTQVGLGATRSLTGAAQGVSGLVDLASKGSGTSRVSKKLDQFAKQTDETAKIERGDRTYLDKSYKLGQLTTDVASFAAPGTAAKVANRIPAVAKATNIVSKVTRPLTNATTKVVNKLATRGATGRLASTAARSVTDAKNVTDMVAGTGLDLGAEASKGRDISKKDVALSIGTNAGFGVGLPLAGQATREAASLARKKAFTSASKTVKAQSIPITKLLSEDTSGYSDLDPVRVAHYKNEIANGRPVEPIIAMKDKGSLPVEDGKHRLQAYKELGITDVPTKIVSNKELKQLAPSVGMSSKMVDAEGNPTSWAESRQRQAESIQVKQVRGIPVDEMGSMPDNIAPTPKSDNSLAVSNEVTVPTKQAVALPAEVQSVLDDPRRFTKQQVASARNQRKLANQMAKTKEQTAEAIGRIDSASPDVQTPEGFVPTGEFGKSVNGGAYQKVGRASEMQTAVHETANLSPGDVLQTARTNSAESGTFNRRDIRNVAALFETKRMERGTPEWNEARQILKEDGTHWGQAGALRNYTMRRSAKADELVSRFESKIYRLADDPSKIDSKIFDEVEAAETHYVDTRDFATQAYNRFTESPTSANAKAYHTAQDAADAADKAAKTIEYKAAHGALKGNTDVAQARELEKMAQNADLYQMDAVDASMLSGTGTFVRNFTNSAISGVEEGLFGGTASRIAGKMTGQKVGGGVGRGSVSGFGDGLKNIVDASKSRADVAGKNPFEHAKNWATTGNQVGDSVIDGQVKHNVLDHYRQTLKDQGYKGRELTDRASVIARQDPDGIEGTYQQAARVSAGLGSGVTRGNKIETAVKNIISDAISGGNPNKYTEGTAKLVTRLTLGFPTAIGRSVSEGAKRFALGAPTFVKAMATKDPQAKALLIKEGIKQAGSGALIIPPMFYALGASGAITGGYPEDQSERDQWARDGVAENSIKIGNDYYQLPAYLGSWAIPGLFYASLGRNGGDFAAAAGDVAKAAPDLLPTGGIDSVLDVVNGRKPIDKYMSQLIPSAVRASTPTGALLNQLAKTFDTTQNETNDGSMTENIINKIMSGIPGLSNGVQDKTDAEGNVLKNPDGAALALGATSTEQQAGIDRTAALDEQTNSAIQSMSDSGALSDPNIKAVITDEKLKKIYSNILAGKTPNPDEIKQLQQAMVKGVDASGSDTAYLEREQYDTNLSVLNIKRGLMANDPTTKPSDLKKMDTAIKRGSVYKDQQIPYDLIHDYQTTGLDDWRAMGDPESDDYNPEAYQRLWSIDELMTQSGVSYAKGSLDKQKYSAKKSKGGKGSKSYNSDFGTIKAGISVPNVKQYETIDQQGYNVPIIQAQRPNIVHNIGFSG